jgi:putative endonuclease
LKRGGGGINESRPSRGRDETVFGEGVQTLEKTGAEHPDIGKRDSDQADAGSAGSLPAGRASTGAAQRSRRARRKRASPEAFCLRIAQCLAPQAHIYGTNQPKQRLFESHRGVCPHTGKFVPWRMETLIGFTGIEKAFAFERYLKSGSGRAFSKRHFD